MRQAMGVISSIVVQEGENVEVGALLGEIGGEGAVAANDAKPAAVPAKEEKADVPAQEARRVLKSIKSLRLRPSLVNDNNLDVSKIPAYG